MGQFQPLLSSSGLSQASHMPNQPIPQLKHNLNPSNHLSESVWIATQLTCPVPSGESASATPGLRAAARPGRPALLEEQARDSGQDTGGRQVMASIHKWQIVLFYSWRRCLAGTTPSL